MLCVVSLCCFSLFFVVLFPDLCPSKGALPDMEEQAAPTTDASGSLWDFAVDPNVVGSSGEGGAARNMSTWSTLIPSGIPWNSMFFGTEGHDRHMRHGIMAPWHGNFVHKIAFCPLGGASSRSRNCRWPVVGHWFYQVPATDRWLLAPGDSRRSCGRSGSPTRNLWWTFSWNCIWVFSDEICIFFLSAGNSIQHGQVLNGQPSRQKNIVATCKGLNRIEATNQLHFSIIYFCSAWIAWL